MSSDQKNDDRRITYFAATHTRGKREMFGIRAIDRGKHMYVIGKTGMGKSTMLENMAIQDIQNGEGIAYIDPHGSTADKLLDFVPYDRIKDVVYFAPFDVDHPLGFNVMEDVGYDKRHLVVSGLMGALKRIWVDAWSARMEYILQNTLLALLEYPGSNLLDVNRMLTNKTFRTVVVEKITDPIVRAFWTEEFANFTDTYTREATPAIQNKIGQFTANPLIRNIVGQSHSSFDLRKIMDEKKIFIVNLSKGRMGESNASLLGSMLTVKIYLAAMSRADEPPARMARLPRCYFYVDEFQSMMNEAFADILSESRKYKLALTLANQYIEQMEENVRDAVFGNVGTLITFRVGPFDAETLKTVFEPTFTAEDLVGLGIGEIYLTLMIDGVGSAPFSAQTIPPIEAPNISYREDVITHSREHYGRPRPEVEKAITERQREFIPPPPEPKKKREYGRPGGGSGMMGGGGGGGGGPFGQPRSNNFNNTHTQQQGGHGAPVRDGGGFAPRPSILPPHVAAQVQTQTQTQTQAEPSARESVQQTSSPSPAREHVPPLVHARTSSPVAPVRPYAEQSRGHFVPAARKDPSDPRDALRAAISTARKAEEEHNRPKPAERSPLDILHERKKTHDTPSKHEVPPKPERDERRFSHDVRDNRPYQHTNDQPPRAHYANVPKPSYGERADSAGMATPTHSQGSSPGPRPQARQETPQKDYSDGTGEISHEVLRSVLRQDDREGGM
ncbi:hypothetical protein FJY93_00530 [Candidatus Kaiserbacteria bacterium]|nr:hypothetical protein [Candidatus Kaiserbacteria bacterium]